MVAPAATKTVGNLITYVKRQFGDESGVQITDADIIRWINAGAMEIVSKNPIKQAYSDTTTVVGQRNYSMPTDIISMSAVEYDSTYMLTATSIENLKEQLEGYQTATGIPRFWYMWANEIFLWPEPSEAVTLRIYYIQAPTGVTVAADLCPVPDRYYARLCDYVLSKAYELDEDAVSSAASRKLFEEKLNEMSLAENTQQGAFHVVGDDYDGGYYAASSDPYYNNGWY